MGVHPDHNSALEDPHTEFCLLRWCLSLPKVMHLLRSPPTIGHWEILEEFDHLKMQVLTDLLGAGLTDLQVRQAMLPVTLGGMGLQAATDHVTSAFVASIGATRALTRAMLGTKEDTPSPPICQSILDTLTTNFGEIEPVTEASLEGPTQRQLNVKVDSAISNFSLTSRSMLASAR